jgi:hypothetical protein
MYYDRENSDLTELHIFNAPEYEKVFFGNSVCLSLAVCMYMYAYMCACMYVCMDVCMYVCELRSRLTGRMNFIHTLYLRACPS